MSRDVDQKSGTKQQEIREIQQGTDANQKEIERLRKQIQDLEQKIGAIRQGIEKERVQSVARAAPEILSTQAVRRLREIQRQQRGLTGILQDPKVQRMLQLDDEQRKKIETIKTEFQHASIRYHIRSTDLGNVHGAGSNWTTGLQMNSGFAQSPSNLHFNLGYPQWISNPHLLATSTGCANCHTDYRYAFQSYFLQVPDSNSHDQVLRKLFNVLTEPQQKTLLDWVGEPYESPTWKKLRSSAK